MTLKVYILEILEKDLPEEPAVWIVDSVHYSKETALSKCSKFNSEGTWTNIVEKELEGVPKNITYTEFV